MNQSIIVANHYLLREDSLIHFVSDGTRAYADFYQLLDGKWKRVSKRDAKPVEDIRKLWRYFHNEFYRVTYENYVLALGEWE